MRLRRLPLVLLVATLLPIAACAAPVEPDVPAPAWAPCPDEAAMQCASIAVPLDHADPDGPTITLAAARLPATRPEARTGATVLHRGGPGYSSVEYLGHVARGELAAPVDDAVRERHDLVVVDQRGTGRSEPRIDCGPPRPTSVPYPTTAAEYAERAAGDDAFRAECARRTGDALRHVGTVAAVDDLDLVRRALGEERLSMVGQSYGTYVASVYAQRHPDRVGRLVLDSVVEAAARARQGTGQTFAGRSGGDVAGEAVLAAFLDRCRSAGPACAFGDGDPRRALTVLLDRLRESPVELRAPDGTPVRLHAAHVVEQLGMLLYQPATWAPLLAPYLDAVEQVVDDPTSPLGTGVAQGIRLAITELDTLDTSYLAVTCAETDAPAGAAAWSRAVDARRDVAPTFAGLRAADDLRCAGWPARTTTVPPALERPIPTDGTALIVGNRLDPATPLHGAVAARRLFEHSALLVAEGPGHVAAQQSRCTVAAASAFLLDGTLPADGTSCPHDRDPFAPS